MGGEGSPVAMLAELFMAVWAYGAEVMAGLPAVCCCSALKCCMLSLPEGDWVLVTRGGEPDGDRGLGGVRTPLLDFDVCVWETSFV